MKHIVKYKKTFIFLVVLVLAVGYATVTSTLSLFGNVKVATNTFDVIFVKTLLDDVDVSNSIIKSDKTQIEYSINNLSKLSDKSKLEFYIKNNSSQYDANVEISCSAYTDNDELASKNTQYFNEYINVSLDKDSYRINALQVEKGMIGISLKKLYDKEAIGITFRCNIIANAVERDTTEIKAGKIPGAYVMGMLASTFDSEPQLLNNQTGEVISYDALNELVEVVNSNQAIDSPVGNILTIMGNHAPAHYLKCDGSEYNISDYPYLASYFEEEFGSKNKFGGDGVTTFAVPDLRGEFLRGTGTNSHTNNGNGSNVGIHQDGTWHLNIQITKSSNVSNWGSIVNRSTTYEGSASANRDGFVSIANPGGSGILFKSDSNNTFTSTNADKMYYISRPTNTSVLYVIKYEPTYYMVIKK